MGILSLTILVMSLNPVFCDTIDASSLPQSFEKRILQSTANQLVTSEPTKHAQWRKEITTGVSSLAKKGTPGQAVVFGMNASVVTVGDTINDVLITAGQVGMGRVVVITHTGYGENFTGTNSDPSIKVLQANAKSWLVRGSSYNSSNIMDASTYLTTTNTTALSRVKILFFSEPVKEWTNENMNSILNFVRNGGGLFVSATPWGWAQIKRSNNFNLMLTYKTLLEAGIAFSGNYIWNSNTFYFNKTTHLSHLGIQVDISLAPENISLSYSDTVSVLEQAQFLNPETVANFQTRISLYLNTSQIQLIAPSSSTQTTSAYIKTKLLCYQRFLLNGNSNIAAPKHENFPGIVDKKASNFAYVSRQFKFTAPNFRQFFHTGLYAVPGQAVSIEVLGALPNSTWTVSIGFHYDNNIGHSSWVRWPTVFTRRDLVRNTTFSCGFGGLIVLESPSGSNETITIRVSPAVQAAWYDSQNATSVSDWPNRKKAVGAWGCAQGKWVGFCMPRASFINVDPFQILDTYDRIYVQYHTLRGTKPEIERKRYIIADIAPSAGYMHSGYPIVTSMDVATPSYSQFQFNYTSLTTLGSWGIFHEMGHNMQRGWWTPSGTGEVTVNIFSLKATQMVLGKSPKYAPWLINQKASGSKYLLSPDFTKWKKNPGIALFVYAQVIENYGWDSMKKVMSSYETGVSSTYPTTQQGQIDFFWSKYSLEVGVDLSGLLTKWAIPFNSDFTSKVTGLPPYVEKVNLFGP